ncbi:uncharacterized protein N7459_009408, partial [Penicillium hispanicum]|uniref:uncharacterized protein n=1 Tax=Penicillium hispanicum TaxID=1080232 RepID=UPI0025416C53
RIPPNPFPALVQIQQIHYCILHPQQRLRASQANSRNPRRHQPKNPVTPVRSARPSPVLGRVCHFHPHAPFFPSLSPSVTLATEPSKSSLLVPRTISFPPEMDGPQRLSPNTQKQGRRRRSSSLIYQEPPESIEHTSDQAALPNLNANWVNAKDPTRFAPDTVDSKAGQSTTDARHRGLTENFDRVKTGAWTIHFVLIAALKIFYDIIPGVSQETSWTLTNISYMFGSFLMFHWVRGIPFEFNAGAYDNLNMWEQIDNGDQYTPTKKFLLCVPIVLFLLSTHYTHYDLTYFTINVLATLGVVIPKLPFSHRLRIGLFSDLPEES